MKYNTAVESWSRGFGNNIQIVHPDILLKDWACFLNHLYITGQITDTDLYNFKKPFYVKDGLVYMKDITESKVSFKGNRIKV